MSTIIPLARRLTRHYVGAHQHMDDWEQIGRAKLLTPRQVREGNGIDDAGAYVVVAKIPAGQDPAASEQALADQFTNWGCSHDYDCCGCLSTRASVKRLTPRTFSVLVERSRNY